LDWRISLIRRSVAALRAAMSPDASVDALMAKGCTPQLNRLVDTMAEAEASGG
jgi:hypothetical protein